MPTLNLMDLQPAKASRSIELLRLGNDEEAFIPFTSDVEKVKLHFLEYPSIKSYVRCNGDDCDLCRIGKNITTKYLLPVYSPASRAVAILPIGDGMKPGMLLPQLMKHLKLANGGAKRSIFIRKSSDFTFSVDSQPLQDTVDDGAEQIKLFLELQQNGFELESVYPTYTNDELRMVDEIRDGLQLRGLI